MWLLELARPEPHQGTVWQPMPQGKPGSNSLKECRASWEPCDRNPDFCTPPELCQASGLRCLIGLQTGVLRYAFE